MPGKYTRFAEIPQFTDSGHYQVNVSFDYLEDHLKHWGERGLLNLDPDWQRCHVWTEKQQEAFVEYVLRGGHGSRDIWFNCSSWMKGFDTPVELVDGKQRLEAVRKFLRNELAIFGGSFYKDFTDRMRMVKCDFVFHMNDLQTRAEVIQWYLDINSGGISHTKAELDKARHLLERALVSETI
jgi:hypothetical protein